MEHTATRSGGVGATGPAKQEGQHSEELRPAKETNGTAGGKVRKPRREMKWMKEVKKNTAAQIALNATTWARMQEQIKEGPGPQPASVRAVKRAERKVASSTEETEEQVLEEAMKQAEAERAARKAARSEEVAAEVAAAREAESAGKTNIGSTAGRQEADDVGGSRIVE